MPEIVCEAESKRAAKWVAHCGELRFVLVWKSNVMTGGGTWTLAWPPYHTFEIPHATRMDIRVAQIAAEDKIEEYMRKVYVA